MNIGFIGAGKVGTALGRYFAHNNLSIAGYYDIDQAASHQAALLTSSEAFSTTADLIRTASLVFITVPDTLIASTWRDIRTVPDITHTIICHCSGCLASDVFGNAPANVFVCSVHPLLALSDPLCPVETLAAAHITLEGDKEALSVLRAIFEQLGNPLHVISAQDKTRYHAAAVFASNLVLAPLATAANLMETCGFSAADARDALKPLIMGNAQAFCEKGAVAALTGPVERNDQATAEHHLQALSAYPHAEALYRTLTAALVPLAQAKHPDRTYESWNSLLSGKADQ